MGCKDRCDYAGAGRDVKPYGKREEVPVLFPGEEGGGEILPKLVHCHVAKSNQGSTIGHKEHVRYISLSSRAKCILIDIFLLLLKVIYDI